MIREVTRKKWTNSKRQLRVRFIGGDQDQDQ